MRKHQKLEAVKQSENGGEPEQPPQQTLADLSTEQLKVMAYDQLALLERTQANLRALNGEIARRG